MIVSERVVSAIGMNGHAFECARASVSPQTQHLRTTREIINFNLLDWCNVAVCEPAKRYSTQHRTHRFPTRSYFSSFLRVFFFFLSSINNDKLIEQSSAIQMKSNLIETKKCLFRAIKLVVRRVLNAFEMDYFNLLMIIDSFWSLTYRRHCRHWSAIDGASAPYLDRAMCHLWHHLQRMHRFQSSQRRCQCCARRAIERCAVR